MVLEPKQIVIAYRCPDCTATVKSHVGMFSLAGDMLRLKCTCGGSDVRITKTSDGKLRFTVPCIFCGQEHSFVISKSTLTSRDLFTVPCSYAGIDILFIGKEDSVNEAIDYSDEQLEELLGENDMDDIKSPRGDEAWGDAHLQDMVIFTLQELCEEGNITCKCGSSGEYVCETTPDSVKIYCKKCGYSREISCEEGSLGAHILFDCEKFPLLPPEENE